MVFTVQREISHESAVSAFHFTHFALLSAALCCVHLQAAKQTLSLLCTSF